MTQLLCERLGGSEGIASIANDLVENHTTNPAISARFADADLQALRNCAANFLGTGTGGPDVYKGEDMLATHKGMNFAGDDFLAVLDDAMEALDKNNISQREKEEVLFVLYSMKGDVVRV